MKSRYAIKSISSNLYQTMVISGNTNLPLATLTSAGTYTQGYVYAPYILTVISNIKYYEEFKRKKILKQERKEKIEKLKNL